MQYLLVENKQIVHLGPIFWRHRFIQSEVDDLEIDYIVSPTEPESYVKINDSVEIYPVVLDQPSFDPLYEQLEGPFWNFENQTATGTYNVIARDINHTKDDLKALASSERYKKEISGVKHNIQNTEVTIATDRDSRNIFTQKLIVMNDTDTIQWKLPENWTALSKTDLIDILNAINNHVQAQFDWEKDIVFQINSASTFEELKSIVIVEKKQNIGVL